MLLHTENGLTDDEIDKMKVVDLKRELTNRNLDTKGLKADLQERLKQWVANNSNEEMDAEATQTKEETATAMETEETETAKPVATENTEAETSIDLANLFPVWVGDIPGEATEKEINDFFAKDGARVVSVKVTKGKGKHQGRQFAFVNFESEEAQKAAVNMTGVEFQGQPLQISPRENLDKLNKIFLGSIKGVETQAQLEEELKKLGDWNITKVQFKDNSNYGFIFFETSEEANQFYDDMRGKEINDSPINVEFPRTKEERDAIKQGVPKSELEKIKRTVYLSDLNNDITEQKIREFCDINDCGSVVKINKPKAKKNRAIAFIEFERKTDADRFVKKFGKSEVGELAGEHFLAEISRAKPGRLTRRNGGNFGRGYRGRGAWGGRGGGSFPGYNGYNPMAPYAMPYAGYYGGGFNFRTPYYGYPYAGKGGRGRARQGVYKPY